MNRRTIGIIDTEDADVRMMDVLQGARYVGIGRNMFRDWANAIGARRHFGKRTLFDKKVIDEALDKLEQGQDAMQC